MRTLTYYIGTTVDGFIADPDGGVEFFDPYVLPELVEHFKAEHPEVLPTHLHEPLGLGEFEPKRFDTIIQGRTTYDAAYRFGITSPFAHLRQYVVTRSLETSPDPAVELVAGDVVAKVRELKAEEGGLGIYLAGGADLAGQLADEIDEFVVKTYPVFAGDGVPMSRAGFAPRGLELTGVKVLDMGVVISSYTRKR
ncbi:dihydrofolate reductase family protein [Streptomyces sp. NPDC101132]|uniref:dihydrofolate reductase family protein n=1 Tax=Streptomyces sp. NPDC101132 TaxID=3366110 RepID=UPI0038169905